MYIENSEFVKTCDEYVHRYKTPTMQASIGAKIFKHHFVYIEVKIQTERPQLLHGLYSKPLEVAARDFAAAASRRAAHNSGPKNQKRKERSYNIYYMFLLGKNLCQVWKSQKKNFFYDKRTVVLTKLHGLCSMQLVVEA